MTLSEDFNQLLIIIAIALPIGLVSRILARLRFAKFSREYASYSRSVRWPLYAVAAALFFFLAAACRDRPAFAAYFVCFGLMEVVVMILTIWRQRAQWSIHTLLLITLIVALVCSLLRCLGWTALPLLTVAGGAGFMIMATAEWLGWLSRANKEPEREQ